MASAEEPDQSELKRLRDAGLISDDVYEAEVHGTEPEPEPEIRMEPPRTPVQAPGTPAGTPGTPAAGINSPAAPLPPLTPIQSQRKKRGLTVADHVKAGAVSPYPVPAPQIATDRAVKAVVREREAALKAKPFVLSGAPEPLFNGRWFVDERRPVVCGDSRFW